jgi:hypothetical protein
MSSWLQKKLECCISGGCYYIVYFLSLVIVFAWSWAGLYSALVITGIPLFFMGCPYPQHEHQSYQCYSAKYQRVLAYKAETFQYTSSSRSSSSTLYYLKADYYTNEHNTSSCCRVNDNYGYKTSSQAND